MRASTKAGNCLGFERAWAFGNTSASRKMCYYFDWLKLPGITANYFLKFELDCSGFSLIIKMTIKFLLEKKSGICYNVIGPEAKGTASSIYLCLKLLFVLGVAVSCVIIPPLSSGSNQTKFKRPFVTLTQKKFQQVKIRHSELCSTVVKFFTQ